MGHCRSPDRGSDFRIHAFNSNLPNKYPWYVSLASSKVKKAVVHMHLSPQFCKLAMLRITLVEVNIYRRMNVRGSTLQTEHVKADGRVAQSGRQTCKDRLHAKPRCSLSMSLTYG